MQINARFFLKEKQGEREGRKKRGRRSLTNTTLHEVHIKYQAFIVLIYYFSNKGLNGHVPKADKPRKILFIFLR